MAARNSRPIARYLAFLIAAGVIACGVAGMLALETRASSGVGVAVSVTTIPAAA